MRGLVKALERSIGSACFATLSRENIRLPYDHVSMAESGWSHFYDRMVAFSSPIAFLVFSS